MKGAFWITAGTVLSRIGALLAWIPVARIVGDQQFGEIALLQSTITLFGILGGDALGTTAMKYIAEYRDTAPQRAGRILVLSGLLSVGTSLLMAGLTAAFSPWLASYTFRAPHLALSLEVSCLAILFTTLSGAQLGALAGLEAFREMAINGAVASLVSAPLLVIGAWQAGVDGVVWGLVAVSILTWILNHRALRACARRRGIPLKLAGCLDEWRVLLSFSLPTLLAGLVGPPVYWIANTILVRQPDGYAQMGLFNAANQWRAAVLYLTGILASLTLPILTNLRGSGDLKRYRQLFLGNVLAVFLTSMAAVVPLALLAPYIMSWYGPEFAHGWPVLLRLLAVAALFAVNGALGQLLSSSGRMWQAFALSAVWAAVLLSAAWTWQFRGAWGLADAQLLSFAVYTALTGIYCWRQLRRTATVPQEAIMNTIPASMPATLPATTQASMRKPRVAHGSGRVAIAAGVIWGLASYGAWLLPMPAPGIFHILGCVFLAAMLLLLFLPGQPGVRLHNANAAMLLLCVWLTIGIVAALFQRKEASGVVGLAYLFRESFVIVSLPALFRLIQSGWPNIERFVLGLLISAEGLLLGALSTRPADIMENELARIGEGIGLNANSVGYIGTTVAIIALSHLLEKKSGWLRRGFDLGLLGTALAAIVLSKSRTSLTCLAVGSLYVIWCAPRTSRKWLACGAIVIAMFVYSDTLLKVSRWRTTIGQNESTTPLAGREDLFKDGVAVFLESPVFGSGFSEETYHSGYLDAAAKTGLLGLGAILILLGLSAVKSLLSRVPVHWPHAVFYVGLAQAAVEPRILSYGSISAVAFTFSVLLFLSEDLPSPVAGSVAS